MATTADNRSDPVTYAMDLYDQAMSLGDPRTRDWLFVKSPVPALIAILIYYLIVWKGPKLMKDRKPVHLGYGLTVYNFALVAMSSYMTYEFFMCAYLANYSLGCQPVDYSNDPLAVRMAMICWYYYFSKFIEIADTVFFILRKKNNQITGLHVYHHSTMIFIWWVNVRYIPGGPAFFHPLINSLVHVFMYTYYGLSALGPAIQPYLWWKKYVTKIQLFFLVFVHCTYVTTQCDFPIGFSLAALLYDISMILLFCNFYFKAYWQRVHSKQRKTEEEQAKHARNGWSQDSKTMELRSNGISQENNIGKLHRD